MDRDADALGARESGAAGPPVSLIHGGPGASGYLGPVARRLEDRFRVLEPIQRPSGGTALSVATHVSDLADVLRSRFPGEPVALVGHSWGAMLALAVAAEHPALVSRVALVGCGTFDPVSRAELNQRRWARMDATVRADLERLDRKLVMADDDLREIATKMLRVDSHALVDEPPPFGRCDARAFQETWADAIRLQDEGVHPAAFAAIEAPVLMVHGEDDPLPGRMIRDVLARQLPELEYRELPRCGHYPWLERHAREAFFEILREWLCAA